MKLLLGFFLFVSLIFATDFKMPILKYSASGAVVDMVVNKDKLYVATSASCVDIFDVASTKRLSKIEVSKIKNFMDKTINSKVYSVDVLDDTVVLLSQANKGFRRIHLFKDGKLEELISKKDQLYIAKVRFIDKNTLLLGLLSNEIISFDIKTKTNNWITQASHSKFSDFVMNENKDEIVVADESGDLKILSSKDGSLIDTLSGKNLDNVFQVDYKNGIIATAGQDRRVVVYDIENFSAYYKTAPFLIYSVALSPSAKRVAYASDENNNVTVFNTSSKETLGVFSDNKMTLSKIVFLNEDRFLVASDDKTINLFQVK